VPCSGERCRSGLSRAPGRGAGPRPLPMPRRTCADVLCIHLSPPSSAHGARVRSRSTGQQPAATRVLHGGNRALGARRPDALRELRKTDGDWEVSAEGPRRTVPALQRAAAVAVPRISLAERSAARRARALSPLVQLLSNWGKPRGIKTTARKVPPAPGKVNSQHHTKAARHVRVVIPSRGSTQHCRRTAIRTPVGSRRRNRMPAPAQRHAPPQTRSWAGRATG